MSKAIFKFEEVRVVDNDIEGSPGTILGYAAKWEKLSVRLGWFYEKIRKGCFSDSLIRNNIKALWNHETGTVLGSKNPKTLRLREDDIGLFFENDLPGTQAGKDALISVKRGDVDGVSFGFNPEVVEWDETDPENPVRTLVKADLKEVSPTAFPAYLDTSVEARSIENDYNAYKAAKDERARLAQEKLDKETAEKEAVEARKRKLNIKLKSLEL